MTMRLCHGTAMHMPAWEKELGEERVKGRAVKGRRPWPIVAGRERAAVGRFCLKSRIFRLPAH